MLAVFERFVHPGNPNSTNEDKGLDVSPPKDEDPDGTKLLQAADPLERAAKVLKPLTALVKDNIDTWIAAYDVTVRRSTFSLFSVFFFAAPDGPLTRREVSTSCSSVE